MTESGISNFFHVISGLCVTDEAILLERNMFIYVLLMAGVTLRKINIL